MIHPDLIKGEITTNFCKKPTVLAKTASVFWVSSQQVNKRPKSLLGMTQLIVFCIDVRRTYVV